MARGVGLVLALPLWNVSVRMDGALCQTELIGLAKVSCEKMMLQQPFLSAHLDALIRGLPLTRSMKPKDDEGEEDEVTAEEVRSGRQTVLKAPRDVPGAKVVLAGVKDKSKGGATTRGSGAGDAEQAADLERQTQEKAAAKAKRRMDDEMAKSSSAAAPRKKRNTEHKVPRKVAANQKVRNKGKEKRRSDESSGEGSE